MQQPHLVFAALARALEHNPADPTLQQQAEEVAVELDTVDALVEVLADQVEATTGVTRAAVHLTLASLEEKRLANPEKAIGHLRAAAAASPRDLTALEGLKRLHLQRKEWAALAEVLEKLARLQATVDDQLATWRLAASVHEEHLLDEESSLTCWLRVLELAPDDPEALDAVKGLAVALDRPADLARALARERAAATGDRRTALGLQLAEVQAARLNLPQEAIAVCREILVATPQHKDARAFLQRFVMAPAGIGAAAVAALSHALAAAEETEARVELLQARLDRAPDERAGLQAQLDALAAAIPVNPTQSLLKALKQFEEGGDRLRSLPALLMLAERADALDELAEALEAASEEADDHEVVELLRFSARLREQLKQPPAAKLLWNDLLAVSSEDLEALEHLFKLFKQAGEAKNAAAVWVRRARLATGPDKIDRLLEAAGLYEDAGELEAALDALQESLAAGSDPRALRAISRLLPDDRRPALHARVLEELARTEPANAQGKVHLRRAQLLLATDPAAAAAAWGKAYESGGVTPEAITGLQQLLNFPAARLAAAAALEPIHRARKETRQLAEVIEVQLEGLEQPAERVARLTELASLWELASEPRVALGARLRAFAVSSGEDKVRAELARLAATLGAEDELLAAYEDKLERNLEPNPAALWRRLAELHDTRGHREAATTAWEKAATLAPDDLVLLRAYAGRCRGQGDLARLAAVLRRQVEATAEPARQNDLLVELARLAEEQLADPAQAAWAFEQLSKHAPTDRALLGSLQRLYKKCQDKPKWADALARDLKLARAGGSSDEASIALRLAQLKLDGAPDDEGAFELLREVLRLEPANPAAVAGLVTLASGAGPASKQAARLAAPMLETRGDHAALVGLLTAQVAAQPEAGERAVLWGKIADLQTRLEDHDSAFLAAARALREVPHDPALLQRCVTLAGEKSAGERLEELAALLDELGNRQADGPARAELFRALARTQDLTGELDEAVAAWQQVQRALPTDAEAQLQLQTLLDRSGHHAELAALLDQRAANAPVTERPAALLALAHAREKLGELESAADTLLTLFALNQGLDALASLERVFNKLQKHRERAEVLGRLAAAAPEGRGKADRLIQQAKALVAAGELELAVAVFADVLHRDAAEDRAVAELVTLAAEPRVKVKVADALNPVYRDAAHRWQRLAVLEVLVANADHARERIFRAELAQIYEAMGEHRQAFVERVRLVSANPEDATARAEAERVAIAAQLEEELVGAYEDLLERRPSAPVALALSTTIARLYSGRLASPGPAARLWEEVARLDPSALEPLHALVTLYRASKNHSALANVLQRQVPLLQSPEGQLAALTELALLAEEWLSDWTAAAGAWREVLVRAPSDLGAFGALGRMLERLELHAELAELLRRRLKIPGQSGDAIADAQVRLGQLSQTQLDRPGDALDCFEAALHNRADDPAAIAGLEALLLRAPLLRAQTAAILETVYRRRRDLPKLAEALELQLGDNGEARELALYEELATLRENLGDLARAFAARGEVFRRTPTDLRVRVELERLAEGASRLEDLARLYRELLTTALPEQLAIELWRRVAATHQRLGQRPKAAEAWEEVARRRPGDEDPLIALCGLYRELSDFAQLPKLLRNRAELQSSIEDQLALLLELVEVAELQLKDPQLAIDSCRLALSRAPEDRQTLAVLELLLDANRHFDELAQLLEAQIASAQKSADEPLELLIRVRLARVKHRSQNDDGAALVLLQGVLARRPDHTDAIGAATDVMRSAGPAADAAAALLEPLFEKSQAWPQLHEVLGERAGFATGEARVAFLHRVADLQELRLQSPEGALQTVLGLLRESPADARGLSRCLALATSPKSEREVAGVLGEVLPRLETDAAKIAILRPLALLHQKLADPDAALDRWRALLKLLPADDQALTAAVGLLEASWRWGELVAVLEARLPHAANDAEKVALLTRIGSVRDDSLNDARGAYTAFRQVLELSSKNLLALVRLDRLCATLSLWTEQAEILARRIRLEPEEAVPLRLRLAQVRHAKLSDRVGALPLLAEVLQTHHSHPEALTQLEGLLEGEADFGQASDLLLGGYRHLGDAQRLAAFLEWRAALAADSARRRALWLELSKLRLEKQNDPELGFLALARAYKEAPADAALRAQLIELAAPAQSQDALAAVLEEVLPALDPQGVATTSLALGALYEGPLNDADAAAGAYRRALETAVTRSDATALAALAGLDRVLEGLGRWGELLPVLEASLLTSPPKADRLALLLRVATVADEHLSKPERSAAALREVLQLEPGHVTAARRLEALYERTGQLELQLDLLEHLLLHVPALERQAVRMKLARLCRASRPERAVALGRAILAEDPLHLDAFSLLAGHFERGKLHDELGKLLRARRGVTLDPREVASLEFQLGELQYRKLGQAEAAIVHYREVLERSRSHKGALTALVEIYGTLGQKPALAQALAELADSPEAAGDRRSNLLRRAEVLVELGSRDLALAAARGALGLTPDSVAELLRLRAVLRAYDALPELAKALVLLVEAQLGAGHDADAVKTLLEQATANTRLNELAKAAAALERVLTLEPSNRPAFDEARALYGRTADWLHTAQLLEKFLPNLNSAELPVTLDELAELHEAQLKDPTVAFGWACRAVELDPTPTSRRERVERLGRSLLRPADVAKLYARILEGLAFGSTHEQLALALAWIEDDALNQADAAEKTLLALLAHDPANFTALDALIRVFARRGLHARQAGALELKLEATTQQADRAALLKTLAQLHEEKLKDAKATAQALRRLIELTRDPEAAGLLAALHRRHQQWPEALDALQRKVKLALPNARAAVQLELSQLCEQQLNDVEGAIAGYLQTLLFDATSAPAFNALHRLYRELSRPGELLRTIEQRLGLNIPPDEQVTLLYEAAALWEAKGGGVQADLRLERILKVRPKEERALDELRRLRRAGERWTGLIEVLTRHVEVAPQPLQKALLCGELGQLCHQQLRDDDGAVKWWKKALEQLPDHQPAFNALGLLHQLHGRWLDATRMIDRAAQLEKDPLLRAELSHRSAVLLEEKLRDVGGAIAGYQRALASNATYLPSLRKLRVLYQKESNWPGYEQTLAQEAQAAPTAPDRASAGLEYARHLQNRAKDAHGAIRWYEHTLVNAPESVDAAQPLADLLLAGADWTRAARVLHLLIPLLEKAGPNQRGELVRRTSKLGDVERELGHIGPAMHSYEQALKLDATEPGALRGRGELLELGGKPAEAAMQFEQLLKHHEKTLSPSDRADLRVRLTRLFRLLGEKDRAARMVEKALEADPVQPVALRLAIELSDAASAWEKAAGYRQRLAGVTKGDERYQLLVEWGKLAQDQLAKPALAITGYSAALELKPDSLEVLERIHLAYRAANQLPKAAQLQEALVAHPRLPEEARQKETLSLANLLALTLKEEDKAVALLDAALERTPEFTAGLSLLESLLTASRRWKVLDASFSKLVVRLEKVSGSAGRRAELCRAVGQLRAEKLSDPSGAFEAYAASARLVPEDAVAQEALADFAVGFKEHEAEAVAAYVRAIPHSQAPSRLCGALARLAQKRGDHDSMILAAGASALVGTPGPDEAKLLRELARPPAPLRAPVSDNLWQALLLHPSLRGSLGQLMSLIYSQGGERYAAELGDFKLHPKKHRIELRDMKDPAINSLRFIARALGFEDLSVYSPYLTARAANRPMDRHPDEGVGVKVNPTAPLSLFVGEPLLRETNLPQLTAHLAATVALLRPELSMAVLLPPATLSLVIDAALTMADASYAARSDPKLLKAEQKRLAKALNPDAKIAVTRLATSLLRTSGRLDLTATYFDAVRHTTSRAALLVSGDFAPVQARALPMQSSRAQLFVRELAVFAVGGDLHALRVETGSLPAR